MTHQLVSGVLDSVLAFVEIEAAEVGESVDAVPDVLKQSVVFELLDALADVRGVAVDSTGDVPGDIPADFVEVFEYIIVCGLLEPHTLIVFRHGYNSPWCRRFNGRISTGTGIVIGFNGISSSYTMHLDHLKFYGGGDYTKYQAMSRTQYGPATDEDRTPNKAGVRLVAPGKTHDTLPTPVA